jgi:hypothetical protein
MQLVIVGSLTLGAALVLLFCPRAHNAFNDMVNESRKLTPAYPSLSQGDDPEQRQRGETY